MKFGNIKIDRIIESQIQNAYDDSSKLFLQDIKDNLSLDSFSFLKRYKKYWKISLYRIFNDIFNRESISYKRMLLFDFMNMYGFADVLNTLWGFAGIFENVTIDYLPTMNITIKDMLELRIKKIEKDKWPGFSYYKRVFEIIYKIIELEESDFYSEIQRRKIYKYSSQVEYLVCDEIEYLNDLVNDSGEAIDMTFEQIIGEERWLRDREECPYNQKKYIKDKE